MGNIEGCVDCGGLNTGQTSNLEMIPWISCIICYLAMNDIKLNLALIIGYNLVVSVIRYYSVL